MARQREVRDPIHGFIGLEDRECDVVDARCFQRLRYVRQLAMAYLIYPGATHTRFDHTLGVLHVASRMCRLLNVDHSHARLIRLAALLHDIGHGPFSHISESVLVKFAPETMRAKAGGTDKIHELITKLVILHDPELGEILSQRDRQDIIQLLEHGLDQPLYRDIISGPLDADKQDYLLRDSYNCGVRYGVYDLERLHAVLGRVSDVGGDTLAVDEDGVHTLEQFVLARYFLTTQVIRHKGRLISDSMLVRALTLGVEVDRIDFLEKLYRCNDSPEYVQEYLGWNDERLISRLLQTDVQEKWAGRIVRRLFERKLYKRVFRRRITDLSPVVSVNSSRLTEVALMLEGEIAEALSSHGGSAIDPKEVILEIVKAPPPRKSEGSVLIKSTGDGPRTFEDESVLFRSINQSLRDEFLECYAPMTLGDESRRQQVEARVGELITRRVQELLSPQGDLFSGNTHVEVENAG